MDKQFNGLLHLTRYFREAVWTIALLLLSFQPAFGTTKPDGTLEITDGKEQFMSTLSSMPYTKSGAGPILYVLECSAFPPTQAFERDWKGQLDGVEVRRIFVAVNPATANEAGYLARTRNLDDFYAFMNRTKVAPTITSQDKAGVAAAQSMIRPYGKVLKPLMVKNGWQQDSPIPPQFMWETNGHVYVGSYSKDSFPVVLSMLRSGTQTAQASASHSRTPASDSASTPNDSSATETTGQLMTEGKNPEPVGNATTTNSGSTSVGSGGSGPGVLGLRIGMTLAEAKSVLKPRITDLLKQGYVEKKLNLTYNVAAQGVSGPVPNGEYLENIHAKGWIKSTPGPDFSASVDYNLQFTPVPGNERLSGFFRSEAPSTNKSTFEVFEKTLLSKYGTPTFMRGEGVRLYYWSFDANGVLNKPGTIKTDSDNLKFCNGWATLGAVGEISTPSPISSMGQRFDELVTRCGATFLVVQLDFDGYQAKPDATVNQHQAWLAGFDLAKAGMKEAMALTDKAAATASAAAIKKGQQQKPEF